MKAWLEIVAGALRRDPELWITIAVCVVLTFLSLIGVVDPVWVSSAILATLLLLAVAGLRDRLFGRKLLDRVERIASRLGDDDGMRWYLPRSAATPDMLADMERYSHIAFLGITHKRLAEYIRTTLQSAKTSRRALPWRMVEVYYASQTLGEAYDGPEFNKHIAKSRHGIAQVLTDPTFADVLRDLQEVRICQDNGISTHTGSIFGAAPRKIAVGYAVHSEAKRFGSTHEGLTIRFASVAGGSPLAAGAAVDPRAIVNHYESLYQSQAKASHVIDRFHRTVWDESVIQWGDYASQSTPLRKSAEVLAELISPTRDDCVLDVGSGSGETVDLLIKSAPAASYVLLDHSPQMVARLADRFRSTPNVQAVFRSHPAKEDRGFDLRDRRFSHVLIHQSLDHIVEANHGLEALAEWCASLLRPDGRVVVSAHNSIVETTPDPAFADWKDPLRTELIRRLKKSNGVQLRPPRAKLAPAMVTAAFARHGFRLEKEEPREQRFEFDFEERRRLWRVPAVLDSLVDLKTVQVEDVVGHVDDIVDRHAGEKSMPRTVLYWVFSKQPT